MNEWARYAREYFAVLWKRWSGKLTGGLLAVYLAVQSFGLLPPMTRRIFLASLVLLWVFASLDVWVEQRRRCAQLEDELSELRRSWKESSAAVEDPKVALFVRWPDDDPRNRPLKIVARNKGKVTVPSFQINKVKMAFDYLSFSEVTNLEPDIEREVGISIPANALSQEIDLHDLLETLAPNQISPIEIPLSAKVTKPNGQERTLKYSLCYVRLSDPRLDTGAREIERCVSIDHA
jgi:hypothetical protein